MRTFSLVEGTSDKFWNIDVVGPSVTVNYGRTGTNGQTKTTSYDTAEKAKAESDKLIASKLKKGYVEGAGGGSITPVAPSARPAARASKAAASPAEAQAPEAPAGGAAAPVTGSAAEAEETLPEGVDLEVVLSAVDRAAEGGEPVDLSADERPFDPAAARAWVREHSFPRSEYDSGVMFDALPFDGVPSPAAAAWWLRFGRKKKPKNGYHLMAPPMRERLAHADDAAAGPGDLTRPSDDYDLPADVLVGSLVALVGPEATYDVLQHSHDIDNRSRTAILPALRALVVPHVPAHLRSLPEGPRANPQYVRNPQLAPAQQAVAAAALFGVEDEVRAALTHAFAVSPHGPGTGLVIAAASALSDPGERLSWLERSPLTHEAEDIHPILALTGRAGVDLALRSLGAQYVTKPMALAMTRVIAASLRGTGMVPLMLRLADDPRVGSVAVTWLSTHPRTIAASTTDGSATQRDILRSIVREVRAADPDAFGPDIASPALRRILAELAEEDALATIGIADAPQWFIEASAAEDAAAVPEGPLKLGSPSWALDSLPPLIVEGVRLDADLASDVLVSAVKGANDESRTPRPLVAAVREHMRGQDRDALAVPLLQAFLTNGGKPADRAWFVAAGYLGADGFVSALTPLVCEWPGQSQHQRAVLGLDVLAATGTTSALQAISGIANKSKFKGVQKAAQESLAKIAAIQGLTVDQLEDRVVPDADLDARGVRVLSYGPRSFRVSLSPQGKAVIRDLDAGGRPTGKPRTTLPAPNSKDDPALAAEAKAGFAVLRKQLTEVARIQTARLEKAIVTGRTWPADEHRTLVAEHPVLNALIRPLVWRVSVAGAPVALVRVTEDQEYITVDEDAYDVPEAAQLSLAHPLTLSPAEIDGWRAHLVDYDLVAPLEQLDRATFGLPAGQSGPRMGELPTGVINPGTLLSTLERMGWRRGNPADGGVVSYLYLPFEALGLAAVLGISDGLWTGMIHESGDQRLESLQLCPLQQARSLWYVEDRGNTWLDWRQADPVLISEVRRAVAALAEKMA